MSTDGYREIIFKLHDLGFKGGITAPATRKRGKDFVDWLAISTAHDLGVAGAVTLHVNLGVRWVPLHKMHKAALGENRMQPECFEPLYVLMPHRDVMRWRLAADDSNLQSVTEDLVDAINGEAEEYWRSVSHASRVCQDLQRQSVNNDFPSGLDWPLAVLLTEGREEALRELETQKEQLAGEDESLWLTYTHATIADIEKYIMAAGGAQG